MGLRLCRTVYAVFIIINIYNDDNNDGVSYLLPLSFRDVVAFRRMSDTVDSQIKFINDFDVFVLFS